MSRHSHGGETMKAKFASLALILAVVVTAQDVHALGKKEKGCLVGGAAGGVGGAVLADHALIGAAAGCAVGTIVADKRDKKQQAEKKHREQQARHDARERQRAQVARDERRTY